MVRADTIVQLNLKTQPMPPENIDVPNHFMVPFARNPCFVGQDISLEDLAARIGPGNSHDRVALVGLGGIGYVVPMASFLIVPILTDHVQKVTDCNRVCLQIP